LKGVKVSFVELVRLVHYFSLLLDKIVFRALIKVEDTNAGEEVDTVCRHQSFRWLPFVTCNAFVVRVRSSPLGSAHDLVGLLAFVLVSLSLHSLVD
jgi:hypothetical protein